MMRQFTEPSPSDDNKYNGSNVRDEIERKEEHKLYDLNCAPRIEASRAGRFSKHFDGIRRIFKQDPMRGY